jgi:hypothetical protein
MCGQFNLCAGGRGAAAVTFSAFSSATIDLQSNRILAIIQNGFLRPETWPGRHLPQVRQELCDKSAEVESC